MLGIVGAQKHGVALPAQSTHLLQNPKLVAVVQGRGRLVHDEDVRLLGQGPGYEHQLLLTAGKMGKAPV